MKRQPIRFFVYGTLKSGHGNNRRLQNAKKLGEHTTEPNYTMYGLGGFPAVSPGGQTAITGEVYETDDENVINGVNALEGYTGTKDHPNNWYDTETIDTPYGSAEMFIFKTAPTRASVVESGVWGR